MRRGMGYLLALGLVLAAIATHLGPARAAEPTVSPPPAAAVAKAAGTGTGTGTVSGRVRLTKQNGEPADPTGVVVFLEGLMDAASADPSRPHPQVRQRDLQFSPPLTVVVLGTTVDFPNDDKVFHNVFSFSEAAKFDLGLYKSGSSKSVTLRKAGVVNVYCNIHPEMISQIRVLDSTYFALAAPDGTFRIERVPVGSHPLVAWQPHGAEFRGQVAVTAASKTQVEIPLVQGRPDLRHTRKDGTPYGRYK